MVGFKSVVKQPLFANASSPMQEPLAPPRRRTKSTEQAVLRLVLVVYNPDSGSVADQLALSALT